MSYFPVRYFYFAFQCLFETLHGVVETNIPALSKPPAFLAAARRQAVRHSLATI